MGHHGNISDIAQFLDAKFMVMDQHPGAGTSFRPPSGPRHGNWVTVTLI